VALLDFIANFLMIRLAGATKGVGKRLKAMAEKIMKGLKKTGKGAKQAAGDAVNKARGAVRNAQEALRKPTVPAKPKGPRVPGRRSATTDRRPGADRGPKDARNDRPASRVPDKERERRKEEDAANRDQQKPDLTPGRATDRTPDQSPGSKPDRTPDRAQDQKSDAQRDRTPDKAPPRKPEPQKDKTPQKPKKKETEAPKRPKPRRPKSPLGKALQKVKGKVKAALKKVRNAGKTLGKKLSKSKVGKALKNSGKKMRDFFKKKRDHLRNDKKNRMDQNKRRQHDRKKKENSKESKEVRLQKILARIRPRIRSRLEKGMWDPAFRALLFGMRKWYQLTSLTPVGDPRVDIRASLNPEDSAGRAERDQPNPETGQRRVHLPGRRKPAPLKEDDKVKLAQHGMAWLIGEVTNVDEEQERFDFYGHGAKGDSRFRNIPFTGGHRWKKYNPGQSYKTGEAFERIRHKSEWSEFNDARQVLNYRKHIEFSNPEGMQWHHIHEQNAKGRHTVPNLALTTVELNRDTFNRWFTRPRRDLNGMNVRAYLAGINASEAEHRKWGLLCLKENKLRIDRRNHNNRGDYQELIGR
jgi:hypothetical protein